MLHDAKLFHAAEKLERIPVESRVALPTESLAQIWARWP